MNEETPQVTLVTTDITHPAVDVIEITASSRGSFPLDAARETFNEWVEETNSFDNKCAPVPALRENGLGIALKRAMESLADGPSKDLKILGRGNNAIFTLITTDLSQANLEQDDGKGIGSAEVTARLKLDTQTPEVVVSPDNHPRKNSILSMFEHHRRQVCATHDVKSWLQQQALPALGAMKSPDARGKAWIPATPRNVAAIHSLQASLTDLADRHGKISLYVTGRSGDDASIVDLITDTLLEEAQRVCTDIESCLNKVTTFKGLESQGKKAVALHERLKLVADAFKIGGADIYKVVEDVEINIALAIAALPGHS